MSSITQKISDLLHSKGSDLYGGEAVTQTQHALQCAALAEQSGSNAKLITASLLHDIGHFLEPEFETALERDKDQYHEDLGEAFLEAWFDNEVTQPVKLHVDAKRYLCATDPSYFSVLSPASVQSLNLQGGPMKEEEIAKFEKFEFHRQAIQLRKWDDLAKDPAMNTEPIEHYMSYVIEAL